MSELVGRGITDYSWRVPGEEGNHGHTMTFDVTDGFVGISQYAGDSHQLTDRVLLSPQQFAQLLVFLKSARKHRRETR